jgi:hypothetical protein
VLGSLVPRWKNRAKRRPTAVTPRAVPCEVTSGTICVREGYVCACTRKALPWCPHRTPGDKLCMGQTDLPLMLFSYVGRGLFHNVRYHRDFTLAAIGAFQNPPTFRDYRRTGNNLRKQIFPQM